MEITEVRIALPRREDPKLKAFASIVIDNCFVVRSLKVIQGMKGLFIAMPSRKLLDGSFRDIVHPLNNETRKMIEGKIIEKYQEAIASREAAPEAVAPEEPRAWEETPEVKEETPEVKEETPEVKEETPEAKEETPEVKEETPEVKEETPEVKEEIPEIRGELEEDK